MTEPEFWRLIEKIDRDALVRQDDDAALEPLLDELRDVAEHDLFDFEELLARKLHALDGEVYATHAGEGGESGDGFLYLRCYVVASGRETYDDVVRSPSHIPNSIDRWCEGLLYVHLTAWSELTGEDADDWPYEPTVSYETGSNRAQWPHLGGAA